MTAIIYNLGTQSKYTVYSERDCRDKTDLSAYRSAKQFEDIITMGETIVEPV